MSDIFKNSESLKLNHHNYLTWRNLARVSLLSVDAYEIALGNELFPIGGGNAARVLQHDFRKRMGKGLNALLSACSDEITTQISHIDNLPELWEALATRYNSQDSYDARSIIRNEFDRCIPEKDDKIGPYFARLNTLRQKLVGTECAIDNRTYLHHLFSNLRKDPRFHTTITFMEMQEQPPNPESAMRRIEITEQKHEASNPTPPKPTTADGLFTRSAGGRGGRGGRRGQRGRGRGGSSTNNRQYNSTTNKQYNCTNCNMDNHSTMECKRSTNKQYKCTNCNMDNHSTAECRKPGKKGTKACYHCGQSGHFKSECSHHKRALEVHGPHNQKRQNTAMAAIAIAGSDHGHEDRDAY